MWSKQKIIPVIIPYYKNKQQLKKCKKYLKNQTMYVSREIYGITKPIKIKIYVHDNTYDNKYFTKAVNIGIRKFLDSNCDYMIILNQDMYLEPNAIKNMVDFMNFHVKCGIGIPLQLYKDGKFVTNGGTFEAWPFGRHQRGNLGEFDDSEIYWANGTCMILRKKMIQEIGLFDENFKFICSDSDYSFTAKSRGWQVWRISGAHGVHEIGMSANKTDIKLSVMKVKDMLYFAKKWITGELYKSMAYERDTILDTVYVNEII